MLSCLSRPRVRPHTLLIAIGFFAGFALSNAAAVHDAADQPFRFAPMAASPRSVVVPLSTKVHLAFDTEQMRTHTVWRGEPLNLWGPPYHGAKTPFICNFEGTVLWSFPPFSQWHSALPKVTGAPDRTRVPSRFSGVSVQPDGTSIEYELNSLGREPLRISETASIERIGEQVCVVRRFEWTGDAKALWLLAHVEESRKVQLLARKAGLLVQRTNDVLVALVRGRKGAQWQPLFLDGDYSENVVTEAGTEKGWEQRRVQRREARAFLKLEGLRGSGTFEVVTASCLDVKQARSLVSAILAGRDSGKAPRRKSDLTVVSATNSPALPLRPPSNDRSFKIEHFPLPKDVSLGVTGLDWFSSDSLVASTWQGEIWIIENATGPVREARFRRYARGLNEPLGVHVRGRDLFVVHKPGLLRIRDVDSDGEADRFENVNDQWGYTGNYHSFAFGPVVDSAGDFYAFLCGQRSRWDAPFQGWCVKISADGKTLDGFCSGLRAPNGYGTYGPDADLFMTDNQGNWIGACKLNHLQRGKFYGHPSARPARTEDYAAAGPFEPPAVWFPRKLAPSASGFVTIPTNTFGPFAGQMLVGDFQNAVVTRVALEKVNGKWQGAVWPFAKGFLSGVNRLTFGHDGKLYVGGLENAAWASIAPMETSLDRVSFTGVTPFEVLKVRALHDGFELLLTKPVDPTTATDPQAYFATQFGYKHHVLYGSPEIDHNGKEDSATELAVRDVKVSDDKLRITLRLDGWKAGYVTSVQIGDLQSAEGEALRNDTFYYTLNQIPPPK